MSFTFFPILMTFHFQLLMLPAMSKHFPVLYFSQASPQVLSCHSYPTFPVFLWIASQLGSAWTLMTESFKYVKFQFWLYQKSLQGFSVLLIASEEPVIDNFSSKQIAVCLDCIQHILLCLV